jgi:hypothetical protein
MKKVKIIISSLSLLFSVQLLAQTPPSYSEAYHGNLSMPTSPSPSAAPFLSVPESGVNEATGTMSTEVPLHTIQYGNVTLPIKVSYSYKGKNVFEFQSRMGEGFSLMAGGVITRQVRRLPDDSYWA